MMNEIDNEIDSFQEDKLTEDEDEPELGAGNPESSDDEGYVSDPNRGDDEDDHENLFIDGAKNLGSEEPIDSRN